MSQDPTIPPSVRVLVVDDSALMRSALSRGAFYPVWSLSPTSRVKSCSLRDRASEQD